MSEISLLQLPVHILISIMGQLSYSDLQNVMLTCKFLRDLILNESAIWRLVGQNTLIIHNPSHNSQTINLSGFHRSRISLNWCKGIYKSKIVMHHQINFMPWLQMYNSQALLLSVGSELQCFPTDRKGFPNCRKLMWNLKVPVVERHDVRTNDISRFVVKDGLILCGNRDGCVAVYKMKNIKQKPKLLYHIRDCHQDGKTEVTAVELFNTNGKQYLVTASNSCPNLCIWCLTTEYDDDGELDDGIPFSDMIKCTNKIRIGEKIGIRCLSVHSAEDKLAIGLNGNSKPVLIEVTTGKLLLNPDATNVKQAVRDVGWHDDNTMMYVTHSGHLQLLDIRSGNVVFNVMDPFQSTLYCVKSDKHNAIVVGSSEYSRCVLFDSRNSSRHVQMYFTQKKSSPIYSLDFDSTKLVAAADRSVAVLNFNVSLKSVDPRDYSHPFQIVTT